MLKSPRAECLARWILGGVFVYASIHKITDPGSFARIIYGYQLVPGVLINALAIVMPYVEFYGGVCLVLGVFPRAAAVLIEGLLAVFIAAIAVNLVRGHEFDCGCFSVNTGSNTLSNIELLARDLLLFLVGLIPVVFRGRPLTLRDLFRDPHS
ncbi:DoxX family membrane protein [Desulfatiferula olefinivorans]